MKKTTLFIGALIVLIVVLYIGVPYIFESVSTGYAEKATQIYFEATDDIVNQYATALDYVDKALKWGNDTDANLNILKAQLLTGLDRVDEARSLYESIKEWDPSAIEAVNDLLNKLPK